MVDQEENLYQSLERIQESWGLSSLQMAQLAQVDLSTYTRWMEDGKRVENPPTIPSGMSSAVPILSIFKALERKFSNPDERLQWLFKENTDFDNHKPIDIAASSLGNLFWVSYYLDTKKSS